MALPLVVFIVAGSWIGPSHFGITGKIVCTSSDHLDLRKFSTFWSCLWAHPCLFSSSLVCYARSPTSYQFSSSALDSCRKRSNSFSLGLNHLQDSLICLGTSLRLPTATVVNGSTAIYSYLINISRAYLSPTIPLALRASSIG